MKSANFGSSFTFFAYSHALPTTPEGETLQVFELPHGYVLNVPISALALTVPKKDLKNNPGSGSKLNPRYFLFQNERRPDISVSGWIEQADQFTTTEKIFQGDKIQWDLNGLPKPTSVEFKRIGGWDAVLYNMDIPESTHSNIRAHWIEESTWIDIHISCMVEQRTPAKARAALIKLLGQLKVENTNNVL